MASYIHSLVSSILALKCGGYKSTSGFSAISLKSVLNMRIISELSLLTTVLSFLSHRTYQRETNTYTVNKIQKKIRTITITTSTIRPKAITTVAMTIALPELYTFQCSLHLQSHRGLWHFWLHWKGQAQLLVALRLKQEKPTPCAHHSPWFFPIWVWLTVQNMFNRQDYFGLRDMKYNKRQITIWHTVKLMALSSPLIFKYARHLEAQGQAYDTYKWYLPDSTGNSEFESLETKLRNAEAVLANAPDSDISSNADRAILTESWKESTFAEISNGYSSFHLFKSVPILFVT